MFTTEQLTVIKYCAEECERQGSGEQSVYDMINAWDWTNKVYTDPLNAKGVKLTLEFIDHMGRLVEPRKNVNGFRTIPIGVNDPNFGWIEKSDWREVPRLLTLLIESYYEGNLDPNKVPYHEGTNLIETAEHQFYYDYENIHPFRDGNGRTGKIIYNYLLGRLNDPVMPPNFWNSSNP